MGGRLPVVWLVAVVVAMGFVGPLAFAPASAQISVPLPGSDSKPRVVQRKRYVPPTAPARNPNRIASVFAEANTSNRKLTDSEAASAAGMPSSASAAVEVAVKAETDDSTPVEAAALSPNDDANESADDETEAADATSSDADADTTSQPDETESASEPQDADEESAPTETVADSDADSEDTSATADADEPVDSEQGDGAGEIEAAQDEAVEAEEPEAAAAEATPSDDTETVEAEPTEPADAETADAEEADQEPEPVEVAEAPADDTASSEPEPAEADEADASPTDDTDTATSNTEPAEPEGIENVEAEETVKTPSEPIETAAVEPEPAEESEPAPANTGTIDTDEADTEAEPKTAHAQEHDASVVLEVSPPPEEIVVAAVTPIDEETPSDDDAPKATEDEPSDEDTPKEMAALTPPSEPEPADSASENEAPAASETKPAADDEDETPAAETEPSSDEDETPTADTEPSSEEADDASDAAATEDAEETESSEAVETPSSDDATIAEGEETAEETVVEPPPPPAHPTVATVRSQLADPDLGKSVAASDLKALKAFYGTHEGPPLWVTEEGFTPQAQAIIAEIEKADEWGLDAESFELPPPNDLLATPNAHADDELQLSIAILSYARDAQIGRLSPRNVSKLFDQHPSLRDPKTVLLEFAKADDPSAYLASLHPQHDQFKRLRAALAKARSSADATGRNPRNDQEVQRIIINMERWRWMPRSLGAFHVWNNIPEFNARVIKNGKIIYAEKTIVGEFKYATPFFSAPMRNIVFHPNWTVPPTIVKEDLAPKLEQGGGGIFGGGPAAALRRHGLSVSLGGQPVNANTVDWRNENIHRYTFTQAPGPANVLGKLKFNFPNKHAIYMHDTIEPELFGRTVRTLSHGCIRVHEPDRFAALLLGEDKGWSHGQVRGLLARNETSVISLNRNIPVHLTYFTAVVDESGNVNTFSDYYGIDNRMAASLFKTPARFHVPAPPPEVADTGPRTRGQRQRGGGGLDGIISGLFGN